METRLAYEVELDAPVERVWDYLTDPEKIQGWMHGVEGQQLTSGDEPGVGSTFAMQIREGRKLSEYRGTFLTYDVNRRLGLELVGGCSRNATPMLVDYELTDLGGRTRLEYLCRTEMRGFWVILAPLFPIVGKSFIKRFFRSLKSQVEAPPVTAAAV